MINSHLPHSASLIRSGPIAQGLLRLAAIAVLSATTVSAQDGNRLVASLDTLKKMNVEELMNVTVISISKHPEKLKSTAASVQIITNEDIRRSGAESLPEVLRLATNLQVAQANASQWAISARGFDNVLANKLLVMIDGRSVYTPLYAGVYWDAQATLLEDVDRIEVVSGPGGTLWGANAVNGVINVITKSAADTQGWFAEAGGGIGVRHFENLRYGGELAPGLYYRIYGQAFGRDSTSLLNGANANDDWTGGQGGFRLDWDTGGIDRLTVQGDLYGSNPNPDGTTPVTARGGNVLANWKHTLGDDADFQLKAYYDNTLRDLNNGFSEELHTYDLDGQHRFRASQAHVVTWGFDLRLMDDREDNLPLFGFQPARKRLHLYSLFAQDEIALIADRLSLTVGAKFERNDYTGWETQPSARLAWTISDRQMVWGAISRAVRTPARIDRDFFLSASPTIPIFSGNDDFVSEELVAYELGWRMQPQPNLSLAVSGFYNQYDHLRSAEPTLPLGLPIVIGNGVEGDSFGAEFLAIYRVTDSWRLRAGYTIMRKQLSVKADSLDLNQGSVESNDPLNQFQIQSALNLAHGFQLDATLRYVDRLPSPYVPSYVGLDVRLGWNPTPSLELSIVGQNLLDAHHPEFVPASPSAREIDRSVYGKIAWRY